MDFSPFAILDVNEPLTIGIVLTTLVILFVSTVYAYAIVTVPFYLKLNKNEKTTAIKLQDKKVPEGQIKHEIFWSMMTIVQYSIFTTLAIVGWRMGLFPKFYLWPWEMGWGYFFLSIVLLVLVQDVLFYFTHRLLHTKKLAKYHAIHHKSRVPTVFAVYSFHPIEAFLHALRIPIVLLIFPVSLVALIISESLISNVVNAYSHLNYEPRFMRRFAKLHGMVSATSAYHNLHHSKGNGNYGFYLKLWDRLFGTMFKDTDEFIKNVHAQWEKGEPNKG